MMSGIRCVFACRFISRINSRERIEIRCFYQHLGVKMKKINKTPLAAAMGAAFLSTFSATAVNAEVNPFGMTELSTGYMQVAEADKAAEMACGAAMGGMTKPKAPEGACAGNKKTDGGATTQGSCGAMMKDGKMKPGMEMACGAMMKGKEGACGNMGGMDNMPKK
jgi:uncharacterized low-complexity protein